MKILWTLTNLSKCFFYAIFLKILYLVHNLSILHASQTSHLTCMSVTWMICWNWSCLHTNTQNFAPKYIFSAEESPSPSSPCAYLMKSSIIVWHCKHFLSLSLSLSLIQFSPVLVQSDGSVCLPLIISPRPGNWWNSWGSRQGLNASRWDGASLPRPCTCEHDYHLLIPFSLSPRVFFLLLFPPFSTFLLSPPSLPPLGV